MKSDISLSYSDFLKKAVLHTEILQPNAMDVLRNILPTIYCKPPCPDLIYMIDYVQFKYSFLILNKACFLGYTNSFLLENGPEYLHNLRHQNDFKIFDYQIFPKNLAYILKHADDTISNYRFITNYRLKSKEGKWMDFRQKSCYINKTPEGLPLSEIICLNALPSSDKNFEITHRIEKINEARELALMSSNIYKPGTDLLLTEREVDVLKLAGEGLCSKQIAHKLEVSIHTINNHRKKMLVKTHCKNFPELLKLALRNGINV
jgi:DNA-binding CsgD family transcriptional regulator